MSFIRPEVRALFWRWREVIAALGVVSVGLWAYGAGGLLAYLGPVIMLAGAALLWIGIQRARFRSDGDGIGAVQVDEGQIAYFGPLTGGAIALADLERIALDGTGHPAHWRLEQSDGTRLHIPVNAHGADALFDAFATLPGLRSERLLRQLHGPNEGLMDVWQRPKTALS